MPRVEAIVTPSLLIWARESAGYELEQAASKAGLAVERLAGWEAGESRPTVNQLRELGRVYRRPLAVFYLPEPPRRFQPLHDFRRLPMAEVLAASPELRFAISRARLRRDVARELAGPEEVSNFSAAASLSENVETVAARIRSLLGVSIETQRAWQSPRLAFNTWREAFERAGVLVFQAVDVQVAEMRGISIGEVPLPVVVVNIKDSVRGRIFSMFHEFVHILLRDEALCDMRDERVRRPHEQRVEVFCNQVAGAALVPGRKLRWEELVIHHTTGAAWTEEQIAGLAKRYSVSREVILRRLLSLGLTTEDFYREKRAEYQAQYEQLEQRPRRGFPAPSTLAVSKAGPYFTRAVLQSYYDEQINPSDVADYLEVRLKHLPQIERIVLGYSPAAGGVL